MQKVIKGKELLDYIETSITILSDAVKTTLGPNGNNVIINNNESAPFITNDGVTIAANINDEDEIINTILSIIKESAIKTDSDVGDGTTTTIVLLESIYKNSLKCLRTKSALALKEELLVASNIINEKLTTLSHTPKDTELTSIASISANDENIGRLITDFYLKLNKSDNIKIIENTQNSKDYVIKETGYFIENTISSPYFIKEKNLTIKNPTIILSTKEIANILELEKIIYDNNKLKKDIIIIADSFTDNVINDCLALNYETEQKIILINNPEYGTRRLSIIDDLIKISASKYEYDFYQGSINEFKFTEDKLYFIYEPNENINKYIIKLKNTCEKASDEYEKNFLKNRISKLTMTYGYICVGGQTILERREKKMRFTDALCALNATKDGVIPGSSLPFYQISEELNLDSDANTILHDALKSPLIRILQNSNTNPEEIIKKIKDKDYKIIYNAKNKTFEPLNSTNVLDNLRVAKCAFNNALSIASMLLTTSHLVINTTPKNYSINSFNDEI